MTDHLERLTAALAGRYAIERELGRGGMATVYLAGDLKHGRTVALKVLRPELAAVLGAERFLQEIRLTARLQHPHILSLIDSGEADGFLYYVMPYVAGGTLRGLLDRAGPLAIDDALRIVQGAGAALDYAHAHGVVHRDIKPENILIHEGEAMVADFGIAVAISSAAGERITQTGITLGTPAYMSPEQAAAERDIDGRTDVYSLACVLYEALAGEPPYDGPTAQAVIAKCLSAPIPTLSTVRAVSPGVDGALAKALAKQRADRYTTPGQFIAAVRAGAREPARPRPAPRRRLVTAALVVLVVLVGAATPWVRGLWKGRGGRIAVLYFDNLSPDSSDAYLADGLTEEIIARLGGVSRLAVQSRAAVKRFRGKNDGNDPATVGRTLNVDYLVTGSVRGSGSRVRITVELVNAISGARVWGETYEERASDSGGDLLALEDQIAQSVAGGVIGRLGPAERAALTNGETRNPKAYDHYLRGNFYLSRRSAESDGRRALEEYQEALRLDPSFAAAYGRLGLVYGIYANWPWPYNGLTTDSLVGLGLAAADRAIAIDSSVVDGWLARGFLLIPRPGDQDSWIAFGLDPSLLTPGLRLVCPASTPGCEQESVRMLARATRLAPRDAEVWYQYGRALVVANRTAPLEAQGADSAIERSLQLEPDRAVSAWLLGLTYLGQRRWDDANRILDSAIALGRHDQSVYALHLHARLARHDVAGARADLATMARLAARRVPHNPIADVYLAAMRVVIAVHAGDTVAARAGLRAITARTPSGPSRIPALCVAAAAVTTGDKPLAIALLQRLPSGDWRALMNPLWDPIRGEPSLRHL